MGFLLQSGSGQQFRGAEGIGDERVVPGPFAPLHVPAGGAAVAAFHLDLQDNWLAAGAVSYTHLTLPTICSV